MRRPIHQKVFDAIRNGIAEGKYLPGSKLPSEAVLVRQFETSRITVGRALRDLQQQGWIERRAGSGSYVREQAAPAATSGLAFGLLIPELGQTQIFEPICQGIAQSRQNKGHALLWGNAGTPWELCRQFIARQVDGVFFAPVEWSAPDRDALNARILEAFREARIPVVLLDRDVVPYPGRSDWDLVGIDNRRAGYIATAHLSRDCAANRLCFWAKPDSAPTVDARIAGYREASGDRVVCADPLDRDAVRRAVVEDAVDAVVCANDRTAGQLLGTLAALGVRVPADVRVAGIDDLPFASLLTPRLTTVRQPGREVGEAALSAMLDRVAWPDRAPREILLSCELVVRESSGR